MHRVVRNYLILTRSIAADDDDDEHEALRAPSPAPNIFIEIDIKRAHTHIQRDHEPHGSTFQFVEFWDIFRQNGTKSSASESVTRTLASFGSNCHNFAPAEYISEKLNLLFEFDINILS